jgi:hypothetical protein
MTVGLQPAAPPPSSPMGGGWPRRSPPPSVSPPIPVATRPQHPSPTRKRASPILTGHQFAPQLVFTGPSPTYDLSQFEPIEVKAGTLVLLHGANVHYSAGARGGARARAHSRTHAFAPAQRPGPRRQTWSPATSTLPRDPKRWPFQGGGHFSQSFFSSARSAKSICREHVTCIAALLHAPLCRGGPAVVTGKLGAAVA